MTIITSIVDRHHIMVPWREVLRAVINKMRGRSKGYYNQPKNVRREIISEVYSRVHSNRKMFFDVMTGNIK